MNYGELKTRVLDFAVRPDLTAHVASFVTLAEGMIRRDLRAADYSTTLEEADRSSEGTYTLPSTLLEIRSLRVDNAAGRSIALRQKGLAEIRELPATADVQWFAVNGSTVEFRGVPAADTSIELIYFGHPAALSDDADTNDLLTNHEALYVYGALFFLYQMVQDLDNAQTALDTFTDTISKLNDAAGRKLGGASLRGAYHFGPIYRGY